MRIQEQSEFGAAGAARDRCGVPITAIVADGS
jgi:hypothetical protein